MPALVKIVTEIVFDSHRIGVGAKKGANAIS